MTVARLLVAAALLAGCGRRDHALIEERLDDAGAEPDAAAVAGDPACLPSDQDAACSYAAACCSLFCDPTAGNTCGSGGVCKAAGTTCGGDVECCSNHCAAGTCALADDFRCRPAGETCMGDMECCGRACGMDRRCERLGGCAPAGEICGDDADCCSTRCAADTAGVLRCARLDPMACTVLGEVCARDEDCCSGTCGDDPSGARRCQAAGGCRLSGDRCGGAETCCSGACAPTADQVERCCRADGQRCGDPMHFDGACCSGTCGVAPDGEMRCGAVDGCEPVGDTCERHDQCCSAPGDVCREGLTHPRRCHDTGPCQPAGAACAVPDDCCSSVCAPGPTGALVCQGACVAVGAPCTQTSDCCTGSCAGMGMDTVCTGVIGGPDL